MSFYVFLSFILPLDLTQILFKKLQPIISKVCKCALITVYNNVKFQSTSVKERRRVSNKQLHKLADRQEKRGQFRTN